ncbi:MAG: PAS domain-containing protein, partial [Spirochaetaceae bacterium]|nr:PAS domain-containing protein [Spirochaetaceae bacterium]
PAARSVIHLYLTDKIDNYRIELRMCKKNGDYIWVLMTGYIADRDDSGQVTMLRGALINIDDSKRSEIRALEYAARVELNKEHMDIVAEMSHLAYFEWDFYSGKFVCSPHFAKEFGYEDGEINAIGTVPRENPEPPYSFVELIHPEDLPKRNESVELCVKGIIDHYNSDARIRSKDGTYLWTKSCAHVAEWRNGRPSKIIGGIINVNELRRAENLNKAKSAFLARMSHEIRTPMNAITGMSELVLRENIPPRAREYASGIQQASANLLSLINDILDFSKIEAGSLEIVNTPYLFASLVNDVVNIIKMRVSEKPIVFTVNVDSGIPQRLVGDVTRIRQILLNLLNNAVKYTDKGFISLDITGTRIAHNESDVFDEAEKCIEIEMKVSDSGRGIKEEDLRRLFGEFVQVDTEKNHNIEGTGLGLAIAKNLANAMDGEITVQSEYGTGSAFSFTIPQIIDDEQQLAFVEQASEKNVLIYEARERYAASIKRSLENLQVPCTVVSNYQQLKRELANSSYNWLFAASPLYESARDLIKKNHADTKIVALGGESCPDSGADVFIPLPAHAISIANTLNNRLEEQIHEGEYRTSAFIAPGARVLIIDDILTNLVVAEGLLAPYKMTVNTCLSGEDALVQIKERAQNGEYFTAIFIDHMMPGMDGIETAQAIRALSDDGYGKQFTTVPLIAFTANAIIGMREIFLENGFTDYIVKPIDVKKLDEALRAIIPAELQTTKQNTDEREGREIKNQALLTREIAKISDISILDALKHVRTEANLIKVLRQFVGEFDGYVTGIQDSLEKEDWNDYRLRVHAVKGVLATIGNTELSKKAKDLENAARDGNYQLCRKKTAALCESLLTFHGALRKTPLLEKGEAKIIAVVSKSTFCKKIHALHDAAFKFNSDDSEHLLEELAGIEPDDAALKALWEKAVPAIRAEIEAFEYDKAAAAIEALNVGACDDE